MFKIQLKGLASKTSTEILWNELNQDTLDKNLLDFLIQNNVPIAYNCYGEGVCRKCILLVNGQEYLSCQIFMKGIKDNAIIEVPYL